MTGSSWWRALTYVAVVLLLAAAIGWLFGQVLLFMLLAAVGVILSWLFQMRRVSRWIRRPDREPPEAPGLWGDIFDRIYHLQRKDREERDRLQTAVSYLRDSFASLKNATVLIDPDGSIEWSNTAADYLLGLEYPRDRGQAVLNLLRNPDFNRYFTEGDYSQPLHMESPANNDLSLLLEITTFGRGSRLLFARDVTREEQVEEMRRDFVANVSHELRTPLTVITGYLSTLIDSGLGEQDGLSRPLHQMQQQAERMETLLKDLLWLSRLESAEAQPEDGDRVDVGELLRELCHEAEEVDPGREILCEIDTDEALNGDYRQLRSAFFNLILNALKYSEGSVHLRWYRHGECLRFEVRDVGPGIDAIHLPRLTERFYRIDKSRSQATGGTGLGLAIVKHVLAAHAAHLEIESEPGRGSTFRCVFRCNNSVTI